MRRYSLFPTKVRAAGQAWERVDTAFSQKGRGSGGGMGERRYSLFPKKVKAAGWHGREWIQPFSQKGKGGGAGMGERRYNPLPKKVKRRGVAIEYAGRAGESIK